MLKCGESLSQHKKSYKALINGIDKIQSHNRDPFEAGIELAMIVLLEETKKQESSEFDIFVDLVITKLIKKANKVVESDR